MVDLRRDRPCRVRTVVWGVVVVEQVERSAGLQRDDVVPLPPADNVIEGRRYIPTELLSSSERKFVQGRENEIVADILIRISVVQAENGISIGIDEDSTAAPGRAEGAVR